MPLFECPTCGMQRPEFGYCYDCTQPLKERKVRPLSPEEKAALTCGRISGRSSLAQQSLLRKLGVPTEKSMNWTKYRASQEIGTRLRKQAFKGKTAPAGQPESLNPRNGHRLGKPQESNQAVAQMPPSASVTPGSELHGERGSRSAGLLQDRKDGRLGIGNSVQVGSRPISAALG